MISYLKGKIKNKGTGYVILEVNNVGYQVFVSPVIYADLAMSAEAELYIHHHVREDSVDLFGLRTMEELEMFELLLTVSGVGPKSAMGVMAIASVDDIKDSIISGDSALLKKVSGIGNKTAERLVLELGGKIAKLGNRQQATGSRDGSLVEEIDALMALGYSMQQARDALQKVDKNITDSGERIRGALKSMKI